MDPRIRDVVVVGGGISGLTTAWQLRKSGVDVCLLESGNAVGGCTQTESRDGFLLEKGPFNVMVRDPAFEALLEDVADEVSVVAASKAARNRYIYRGGRLHAVPTNPIALATTGLLSMGARVRLLRGLFLSRRAGQTEETIEQVAARRVGQEAADAIVSAAISGIFAGDIKKLSLRACFPGVGRVDEEARSLIGYGLASAFRRGKKKPRRWRGLVSIDGGLGALTETLGCRLDEDLLTGCRATAVRPRNGGFEIEYHDSDDVSRTLRCGRVVMALPASETGLLLEPTLPEVAGVLRAIQSSSLVVLNLGFRRLDISHPLNGFGFLVPQDETAFPLMGVLWADSIFGHHAPEGHRLIRVFIGGACNGSAVNESEEELVETATGALRDLLGLNGKPVLVDCCRYRDAIPQYHAGHRERIEKVRESVSQVPGLHLVGNYLDGVSLNDCVRLGTAVAAELGLDGSRGSASSSDCLPCGNVGSVNGDAAKPEGGSTAACRIAG